VCFSAKAKDACGSCHGDGGACARPPLFSAARATRIPARGPQMLVAAAAAAVAALLATPAA